MRSGVTFNRTFYFVDRGVQRGIAYEYGQLMEERLNKHFKTDNSNKIHVIFLPLPREMLLSALVDGKVDLVAAQVPVTPELQQHVVFSDPTRTNVRQILVSAPSESAFASIEDLSGKEVFAREFGGYAQSLRVLNERFKAEGRPPVMIREAPPGLEDDDLLEMVNAGLIPAAIIEAGRAVEEPVNQNARSHVGAIGVMQVMPATGRELKVGDITKVEPNIHAGVKYMRQTLEANFADEPMDKLDKALFTFAAYNAGPGRVRQLRRLAAKRGLDPNVWFGNVEQIASERIGRETVTYVSNIYKYYLAYKLVVEERERKAAAKKAVTSKTGT